MTATPDNRAKDEFDLRIIRLVASGMKQPSVATRLGVTRSQIAALLRRVMADDVAMSGEPETEVRAAYRP